MSDPPAGVERESLGIIIVDHGSRRAEANEMLERFVALFAGQTGYPIVEPAHMDVAEPSIAVAYGRCVRHGARHMVVAPFFLAPGRHWDQDIPALAAEAAARHPGTTHRVCPPIGLHPLLVDIIRCRIEQGLAERHGRGPGPA